MALRFPRCVDSLVAGGAACLSEVDGRSWHTDGLRQGKKHSFSLLVGVALSDTPPVSAAGGSGNLFVWPGSHRHTVGLMRWPDGKVRRDPWSAVPQGSANGGVFGPVIGLGVGAGGGRGGGSGDGTGGLETCEAGWEDVDGPVPDLGERFGIKPLPLDLAAGDVLLAHHALAHCGGPNTGCDVRYMLYYRVRHEGWAAMVEDRALERDLWCDLQGTWPALGR